MWTCEFSHKIHLYSTCLFSTCRGAWFYTTCSIGIASCTVRLWKLFCKSDIDPRVQHMVLLFTRGQMCTAVMHLHRHFLWFHVITYYSNDYYNDFFSCVFSLLSNPDTLVVIGTQTVALVCRCVLSNILKSYITWQLDASHLKIEKQQPLFKISHSYVSIENWQEIKQTALKDHKVSFPCLAVWPWESWVCMLEKCDI